MKDVNNTLTLIESLLTQAEHDMEHDDGRRWPPPPVPPKRRSDWATDNSSAVDPNDYYSCKDYILKKVRWRPLLRPGMFYNKWADSCASAVQFKPGEWVRWLGPENPLDRPEAAVLRALDECRELYGMQVEARRHGLYTLLFWSGHYTPHLDTREITLAQRFAELRLFRCRRHLLKAIDLLKKKAWDLTQDLRSLEWRGIERQFDFLVAYPYQDVAFHWQRLVDSLERSNRVSKALYRSSKRRFPKPGYGLYLDRRIAVPYPWWGGRKIPWPLLWAAVAGEPSEDDPRAKHEIERWAWFKKHWPANPDSGKSIDFRKVLKTLIGS
jgi:hypothetical protein